MQKELMRFWTILVLGLLLVACHNDSQPPSPSSASISITSITPLQSDNAISTFQDLTGKPVELSDYAGKRVFLNYWASWCAPCIREIPSILKAESILEDENFVFLLASDESLEDIQDFIADHRFFGNFIKLNTFFASHGVEAMPSSFLFDEDGIKLQGWLGEREWDSPSVLAELRQ